MTTHIEDEDPCETAEDIMFEMEETINCQINDARDGLAHYDDIYSSYEPPPKGVPFVKKDPIYYWKSTHYDGDWQDDIPHNAFQSKYYHCLKELLSKTRKKKKLNIIKTNTDMDKPMRHCIIKTWILSDIVKLYDVGKTKQEREMLNYICHQIQKLKYE